LLQKDGIFNISEQKSPLTISQPVCYEIMSNFYIWNTNYSNCK